MSTDDDLENDPDIIAFRQAQKKARGGTARSAARLVVAFAIAAAVGLGLFSLMAVHAQQDAQDRAERLAQGETVIEFHQHDPTGGALGVGLLCVLAGTVAFVGSYRLLAISRRSSRSSPRPSAR